MQKRRGIYTLVAVLLFQVMVASAGDEDRKPEPKPIPIPQEPEAPPLDLPSEPEAPDMSVGEQMNPIFSVNPGVTTRTKDKKNLDHNIDYSELTDLVVAGDASQGVLAPALGFRGYRHNTIALSAGDRTPGYGGYIEYNWNRIGTGIYYSYRNLTDYDRFSESQSFTGWYLLYRWLPFDVSPYFGLGLEYTTEAHEAFGGTASIGAEANIYAGWTVLFGYTYHSTVRKGFLGGAFGWSF
ncbi:MAG: hypothetical protein M9962_10815 [Oligoflexia bacterium]|nr:hypothetical protein [Oligoflexia bacterium]